MNDGSRLEAARGLAAEIDAAIAALPVRNTPRVRAVRRAYSRQIVDAEPGFVLEVARALIRAHGHRSLAYELIAAHPAAYRSLDEAELVALGQGIDTWWRVDSFGRTLAGPAWRDGLISDAAVHAWARSPDRWWRRLALVSTVALNVRSHGGQGDVPRTLAVCRMLVDDHDDMVVKAMSWALRELVAHDPQAVRDFVAAHEARLAARARREVRNKLETGLKNPRRSG